MIHKICFFILFGWISSSLISQVKIGEWQDHLCYSTSNSVVRSGEFVYATNGNGLVRYNVEDNSVEKLTKINGLSDIGVKLLRHNRFNSTVMAIYDNTNIDIIKGGKIINFPDIKRKIMTGNKSINDVYFENQLAYFACGFGIIVFDSGKLEIKETYYIGPNSSNVNVYQISSNDTAIFAATELGLYYGKKNSLLKNYQNWKKITALPNGPYNAVVKYDSKIITNYSEKIKSEQDLKDTLYQFDGTSWSKFSQKTFPYVIKRLYDYNSNHKLVVLDQFGLSLIKPSNNLTAYITNYGFGLASINDGYYEDYEPEYNLFWIADQKNGLIKSYGGFPEPNTQIPVNGPTTNLVNDLDVKEGFIYMAPTYLGDEWNNQWNFPYLNTYQNKEWSAIGSTLSDTVYDVNCVAIDPNDKTHTAFGSWGKGIIESKNNVPTKVYNMNNSTLKPAFGSVYDVRIGGICFDKNSNLWSVASLNNKFLNVKLKNGTWINFDFGQFFSNNPNAGKLLIDKNNQVWVQLARGGGIAIFKPTDSYTQPNGANTKIASSIKGAGALPSNNVLSMVEDKTGQMWIGTDKGVAVFYKPEDIFNGGNWDSQQILIEQDGYVQILLETNIITSIAIDGANRKWIGTQNSGVFCLSSDGQKEIYHFTFENSPLYSNTIRDIAVDETSGDIFIGSEKGIQSFRTPIIQGFENYTNVHAFPNPIRPGSTSKAYITGLIDETVLKITDVAGNLVWETKSLGGQVEWDLKAFNGNRVTSGTYLIYCSTADGELKATTKLLVIN